MKIPNHKRAIPCWIACLLLLCVARPELRAEKEDLDYLSEGDLYGDFSEDLYIIYDPLEPLNRVIFKFNDFVYINGVRHLANGYAAVTPDFIEKGASNFFQNLKYPVRLAGNLLQGRVKGAWIETERFAVNTTLGIGGFFKVSDNFKRMRIAPEDVGQALGAWGIGEGPYLVLPFLGPSNLRDLVGMVGDRAVNPLDQPFTVIVESEWQFALGTTEFIVQSPDLMQLYMQIKESAIDPYSAFKSGYTDRRRAMIKD